MAVTDIPTGFGPSFFIKTFFPGLIASILYSWALMPIVDPRWAIFEIEKNLFSWIIFGAIFGMMITSLDILIYQIFEGLRFWPNRIWWWKYNKILNNFRLLDDELKKLQYQIKEIKIKKKDNEKELQKLMYKASILSSRAREFPHDPKEAFFSRRRPEAATRFGNVLAEYEQYSEKQYGMHMMVFWQHLWLILPKEIKDELDLRGASVDFLVYLSFIFLSYTLIGGIGFYFQSNMWYIIRSYNIPLGSFFCISLSLFLGFLFYQVSITQLKSYGRYIKAVFDIYRAELATKLKIDINITNLVPEATEIEKWQKYRKYLLDYKKP